MRRRSGLSKSSTEEQVREMAKLTLLTNKLNPIQEKNLKMYPLVFFNSIKSAKMEFDLSNDVMVDEIVDDKKAEVNYKFNKAETKHLHVTYYLEIDENSKDNAYMEKRYEALEKSVRNLLWQEIKVKVYINGNLGYESKNV